VLIDGGVRDVRPILARAVGLPGEVDEQIPVPFGLGPGIELDPEGIRRYRVA
jgi:hypothetical protein